MYDPRDFYNTLRNNPDVHITQDYFTEDHIEALRGHLVDKRVLLVSDIRVCEDVNEVSIDRDLRLQESWVKQLNPVWSQLKFRLPRLGPTKYRYLHGEVYLQMFAPRGSTETRLVVGRAAPSVVWMIDDYENKLYYFNRTLRVSHWDIPMDARMNTKTKGKYGPAHNCLDRCHDCALMVATLHEYAEKRLTDSTHDLIEVVLEKIPAVRMKLCKSLSLKLQPIT